MSLQVPRQKPGILYPESDGKPMAETDKHALLMMNLRFALTHYYRNEADVYVSGNLLIYYEKGNPKKSVAPDVFVARGVQKGDRRIYLLWEERQMPQVIFELSSRATWRDDLQTKWQLYAELGVQEYFIFDPEYDYLSEPLIAYRLEKSRFVEVEVFDGRVGSQLLNLDVIDTGETLRLFDPKTSTFLPTPDEAMEALEKSFAKSSRTASRKARKKVSK